MLELDYKFLHKEQVMYKVKWKQNIFDYESMITYYMYEELEIENFCRKSYILFLKLFQQQSKTCLSYWHCWKPFK